MFFFLFQFLTVSAAAFRAGSGHIRHPGSHAIGVRKGRSHSVKDAAGTKSIEIHALSTGVFQGPFSHLWHGTPDAGYAPTQPGKQQRKPHNTIGVRIGRSHFVKGAVDATSIEIHALGTGVFQSPLL